MTGLEIRGGFGVVRVAWEWGFGTAKGSSVNTANTFVVLYPFSSSAFDVMTVLNRQAGGRKEVRRPL